MRSPTAIQVLLRARCRREEIEEQRLTDIFRRLELMRAEFKELSERSARITTQRLDEILTIAPNTHHQALEAHSRILWQRCADCAAEIQQLKELQKQQMSVYLSARQEREVIESLNKRRDNAIEIEKRRFQEKQNEDMFLATIVAKRDICLGEICVGAAKEGAKKPSSRR